MPSVTLQEYGKDFVNIEIKGKSKSETKQIFQKLNLKFKKILGLQNFPFELNDNDSISIKARGVTGQIRIGNLDLTIIPKYLVYGEQENWAKSLLKMLEISHTSFFTPHHVTQGAQGSLNLIDLIAQYFIDNLASAVDRGQPIGYVEKNLDSTFFRGRMNVPRQAILMVTNPSLVAITTTIMTNDIPLTRLLKWACIFLQNRVRSNILRTKLVELTENFTNVSNILPSLGTLERIRLGGPQIQYQKAFTIALWIAKQTGQVFTPKFSEIPGILLKSDRVFEDFVSSLFVKLTLKENNWSHFQQKKYPIAKTDGNTMAVKPDDVISINNKIVLISDSKYKGDPTEDEVEQKREDVYQLLATCRATRCERGLLIYPMSTLTPLIKWNVTNSGNPEKFYTLGITPSLLSKPTGLSELLNFLDKNIRGIIQS